MKKSLLALMASVSLAPAAEWVTLSGIGDQIELKEGELALLVSTSKRSYMKIDKPGTESLALDIRPYRQENPFRVGDAYQNREPDVRIRMPRADAAAATEGFVERG